MHRISELICEPLHCSASEKTCIGGYEHISCLQRMITIVPLDVPTKMLSLLIVIHLKQSFHLIRCRMGL